MLNRGESSFNYTPHLKDHLYEQSEYWIAPNEVVTYEKEGVANMGGKFNKTSGFAYATGADYGITFPFNIPNDICGHPVVIDSMIVYYRIADADSATNNSADYIDSIKLISADRDDTCTTRVDYSTNIGDDTYDDYGSQELITVGSPYEMVDSSHWIEMALVHDVNVEDVRIYGFYVKYHAKVHG
jgi:hypothetical protein